MYFKVLIDKHDNNLIKSLDFSSLIGPSTDNASHSENLHYNP